MFSSISEKILTYLAFFRWGGSGVMYTEKGRILSRRYASIFFFHPSPELHYSSVSGERMAEKFAKSRGTYFRGTKRGWATIKTLRCTTSRLWMFDDAETISGWIRGVVFSFQVFLRCKRRHIGNRATIFERAFFFRWPRFDFPFRCRCYIGIAVWKTFRSVRMNWRVIAQQ